MKYQVSTKNEFPFFPDIGNNLKLPESERFAIVLRRVNTTLNSSKWASYGKNGGVFVDLREKMRDHIVGFKNPLTLLVDGKEEKELTVEELLSDKYPELGGLIDQIVDEINKLLVNEDGNRVKK